MSSCPTRAHQPLPEEEETAEMMAFTAASPTPITTEHKAIKATRRRDELGDRVNELRSAAKSQKARATPRGSGESPPRRPLQRGRGPLRWLGGMSKCVGSRRPGGSFPIDHGYIDLSMSVLLAAERAARAVPTSAAKRAVYIKGRGAVHGAPRRHPLLLRVRRCTSATGGSRWATRRSCTAASTRKASRIWTRR